MRRDQQFRDIFEQWIDLEVEIDHCDAIYWFAPGQEQQFDLLDDMLVVFLNELRLWAGYEIGEWFSDNHLYQPSEP